MSVVLRTVTATRYVTPLREGGSLPAIVEADDYRVLVSKQTGDAAAILDDGDTIGLDEIDPAFTHQEA